MSAEPDQGPPPGARGGFARVLIATVLIGIAGYVITWLVPRVVGVGEYTTFALFWSFTFLLAAGLSGVQQELTRATRRSPTVIEGSARPWPFATAVAVIVTLVILATSPWWSPSLFPAFGAAFVLPLVCAAAAYTFVAVLSGTLYGLNAWNAVALCISIDGVSRLVLIALTLTLTHDPVALAWATALPFAISLLIVGFSSRKTRASGTSLDIGYRELSWNSARTVIASISMGMLVSGFPLLLGFTSSHDDPEELGALILLSTLVRAPLIVVGMALQSFLLVLFRDRGRRAFFRLLAQLHGVVIAAGLIVAAAGWWIGPPVFEFLFPGEAVPSGALIGILALASALVGALCITAPAALSRSLHGIYATGWVVAALSTVICLVMPIGLEARVILSLLVGPLCGLAVHLVGLLFGARLASTSTEPPGASKD